MGNGKLRLPQVGQRFSIDQAGRVLLTQSGLDRQDGLTHPEGSHFARPRATVWPEIRDGLAAAGIADIEPLLLTLERRAQSRMRFAASRSGSAQSGEARPVLLQGRRAALAVLLCATPVLLGFVLPVGWLVAMLWREAMYGEVGLPLARFGQWAWATSVSRTASWIAKCRGGFRSWSPIPDSTITRDPTSVTSTRPDSAALTCGS